MILNSLDRYRDFGILLIRVGVGFSFILIHGLQKFQGGPELWLNLGKAMSNLGITFLPQFWGFMSMFAEFFCPMFLILGLFFRPAAFILTFNMFVALMSHFSRMDPWGRLDHAMNMMFVFAGLFIIGAGKYSIDEYLSRRKARKQNNQNSNVVESRVI